MTYIETIALALRQIDIETQAQYVGGPAWDEPFYSQAEERQVAHAVVWQGFVDRGIPASWRTVSESE